MNKLRVLVLVHEDLVPPDSMRGYTDKEIIEWKTEYDVVTSLREMGHEVYPLGVHDDLGVIRKAILEWKPHIAFNLLEEFHGHSLFDYHVASYLELMQQAYTGSNPRGLMLAHDKALSKKLLSFHRINIPGFAVIPIGKRPAKPARLQYPLFVKSLCEEGSYGIAQASVVHSDDKFTERVSYLHEQLGTPVLVEEYIEGRELYLSIIGNTRLQTFPLIELKFGKAPDDMQKIATSRVKWDWAYQKKYEIDTVVASDLTRELQARVARLGKRIFRILSLTGYARLDLRMTDAGRFFVLEANANPDVGYGEELSCATEAAGMHYEDLLQRIMNLGMRYDPRTRVS